MDGSGVGNHGGGAGTGGGDSGTRRGSPRTRGGKVPSRDANVLGRSSGSGTRNICIQEPNFGSGANDSLGKYGYQKSSFNGKGKKSIGEGKYRQTCGGYVVLRGGKSGGVGGSNSRVARGDEMADMAGVIRNVIGQPIIMDNEDDGNDQDDGSEDVGFEDVGGEDDGGEDAGFEDESGVDVGFEVDGGEGRLIKRIGKKFANGRVHRSAIDILVQNLDGDWETFSKVPHSKLWEMFNSFRTLWRWDPRDEYYIFEGFINVLKGRFQDMMCDLRGVSKDKARKDGHVIGNDEERFEITSNYPPDKVPLERWQRLCKFWNIEKWLKRSKAGRKNRRNDISRHTDGLMGFDEHRIRLEKQKGGPVSFDLVFIETHATKDTKKRLREGDINIKDLEHLEFVTPRSKQSYASFPKELEKEHGSNNNQNQLGVWEHLHLDDRGQMFGIGSSDPHFVVIGTQSSYDRQSQEVKNVQSQLEKEREAQKNLENRLEEMQRNAEIERAEREKVQKEIEELKRNTANK